MAGGELTRPPWIDRGYWGEGRIVAGSDGKYVAMVFGANVTPESDANFDLILRAPVLNMALRRLLKEYVAERDAYYDGVTNADGEYDDDENRQAVEEMDRVIDEARAALGDGT